MVEPLSDLRELLIAPFERGYMGRALIEVCLLALLGGVVGTHVLLRRRAFLTEVVQHTVFPGMAIAFAAGHSLLVGALGSGALSVALFTIGLRRRIDPDALMAMLIATFFALGVIVVSRGTSYQSDLTSLLFGRILAVDRREILDTAIVAVVAILPLLLLHKELVAQAFDRLGSEVAGYPGAALDLLVNLAVMLSVVATVRAVGTVLVVAFLVTPAATARLLSGRVGPIMAVAAGCIVGGGWLGLLLSYHASIELGWRLAPGATIVAVLTLGFVLAVGVHAVLARPRPAGARWPVRRARAGTAP